MQFSNTQNNSIGILDFTYSDDGFSLTGSNSITFDLYKESDDFYYLRHSVDSNSKIGITYILSLLQVNNFEWKTYLDNITFYDVGNYNFITSISDEWHKDSEYLTFSEWYIIKNCNQYIPSDINGTDTNYKNFTGATNVLLYDLCGASDAIIEGFGVDSDCVSAINWVYIIITFLLSIGLSWAILTMMGNVFVSSGLFFLMFSIAQVLVYPIFLFGDTAKVIYAIMFVLGVGSFVVGLFGNTQ
jgi:hypothetical protein